jgi:hypothetical protein
MVAERLGREGASGTRDSAGKKRRVGVVDAWAGDFHMMILL